MKRVYFLALLSIVCISSCQRNQFEEELEMGESKKFTFTVKGDFGAATFTRGYLQADGQS